MKTLFFLALIYLAAGYAIWLLMDQPDGYSPNNAAAARQAVAGEYKSRRPTNFTW